jgi:threonine dehydrogenase-like Zn-dependent dehydrogenase
MPDPEHRRKGGLGAGYGDGSRWAAADYPPMLALIQGGTLRPQQLIERVISLDEAAALLPRFDRARLAGMTMIDPQRP